MKKILILATLLALVATPVLAKENITRASSKIIDKSIIIRGELIEIVATSIKIKKNDTIYQVNLTEKTNFVRKFGGKSKLSEFTVGDTVQVVGKEIEEKVIEAQLIRDISIQKRWASFEGKVISINASEKSFVLKPNVRKEQTVFVTDNTKITKNGVKITFTDIAVNDKVNVSGIWNTKNNTLTAEKIIIRIERFIVEGKITAIDNANNTIKVKAQIATPKDLKGQEVTINLTPETKIHRLAKKWTSIDLAIDQRITVKGIKKVETLTAQQILVIGLPKKIQEKKKE